MILQVSLGELKAAPLGEERQVRGLRQYVCDDVTIFTMTVQRARAPKGGSAVVLKGLLRVRPSFDRRTTLRFDLFSGDRRVASPSRLTRLKTEEGKVKAFEARLELTPEEAAALFGPPDAYVRIEMTVWSDD